MSKIYVVIEADRDVSIYGVYDREGFKEFVTEMKKQGRWSRLYTRDDSGKERFWKRQWTNPMWSRFKVISYTLNKQDYGMQIDWWKFR
jgi:hypothetical protein